MVIIVNEDSVTNKWIEEIKKFILYLNIDENLKIQSFNMLDKQYDMIKDGIVTDEIFGAFPFGRKSDDKFSKECLLFMNYLNCVLDKKGKEYFETAINYSLDNSSESSFLDAFIKFITITNFNDIEFEIGLDINKMLEEDNINNYDGFGFIRIYLGGFLLCDISGISAHQHEEDKFLHFNNLHVRKNLKRTKLGTIIIKKMLDVMIHDEKLSDYSLCSCCVMKNNAEGKRFYEKIGFKFLDDRGMVVDYSYYDKYIKIKREDYPELSEKEFNELNKKMGGNFSIVILSQDKNNILAKKIEYPYVIYNDQIIDCNTMWNENLKNRNM